MVESLHELPRRHHEVRVVLLRQLGLEPEHRLPGGDALHMFVDQRPAG